MTKKILLASIIILAFVLRFYRLNDYPALNADEAAIGYNAYSLIQNGRDEHGNPWPVHFQSFNDYKPGLCFYLVLPFVKTFGLNEWAVRLPGAVLGVLTVLIVYFLVKELFPNRQKFSIGEITALMLAISPWHIHFSRGGWEVNVATFFITLGILMFLKALKRPGVLTFTFSFLPFTLSLYAYHAARVVVPLLGLGMVIIYREEIFKNFKKFILALFVGIVLLIPLAFDFTKGAAASRMAGVGLFADPGPLNRVNEQRGEHYDFLSFPAKVFHNKAVNYGLAFLQNWASHYHGEFLFLSGDAIQRNKVPETGQMYLFDILFLTAGFAWIIKGLNKSWKLILWWLLVAPSAAALTFQAPHALRSHNMIIPLVIISSFGFMELIGWLWRKNLKAVAWILVIFIVWQFARYEHMYWVHMAKEYPYSSQYGVKELVSYISGGKEKYQNIVVTDRYDQPYILFLFYTKFDPTVFQREHELTGKDKFGFSTVRSFDNYRFVSFGKWDDIRAGFPDSLIIGTQNEIPKEANIIKRIYGTNGFEYFDAVAN